MKSQLKYIDDYWSFPGRKNITKVKVILGVGHFNLETFKEGQGYFVEENCPITQCITTRNTSVHKTADAVLISEYGWGSWPRPPKPPHQVWIAQHWESPKHNRIDANAVKDLINWTASYRRESTIVVGYGHYEKIQKTSNTPVSSINYAAGKTKQVAMLVSNCNPANDRMDFARQLSRYIAVDVFGKCGSHQCPKDIKPGSVACVGWLSKHYKFYLAFENSNCKDYITEKFLANALKNNILPVVYGAARVDYAAVAPPHSYIHVHDFPSVRSLAEYLQQLNNNDTLYNEYFAWKGTMDTIDQRYWCRLCMLLHLRDEVDYVHWYKDYRHWWNDVCPSSASCLACGTLARVVMMVCLLLTCCLVSLYNV